MSGRAVISMVVLRELGAGDGHVLDAVFAGLSVTSRFRRFHGAMPALNPGVRRRLVAVDGRRHLAVGAFADGEPIGIARLIVVGPGRAELAVEVVDAWHGCGVGSRLVRAVTELGVAACISEIYAHVLAENRAVQRLLASVYPDLHAVADGPEITFVASLPPCLQAAA